MTNIYAFPTQYQPYEQPDFQAINRAHELIANTGRVNYLLPGFVGIDQVYADVESPETVFPPVPDRPANRHGNGYAGASKTRRQFEFEGYAISDELAVAVSADMPVATSMTEEDLRAATLRGKSYANGFGAASTPSEQATADRVLRWDSQHRKSN